MSNDTETKRPKTDLEEAREKIGDLKKVLEKEALELGWDIDVSDDFQEAPEMPTVRFIRKSTVGDAVRAEQMATQHYGDGKSRYVPTGQQITIAKLCLICTFNGDMWNIPKVERLGEYFFSNIVVRFPKLLGT